MITNSCDLCVDQLEEKNTETIDYCYLCHNKKIKEKELKVWKNFKFYEWEEE